MDNAPQQTFTKSQARDHAKAMVLRSGTSFFWAMRRLDEVKRDAMYAIYAYCREVDDIADDAGLRDDKMARLLQWRLEIERLYAGGQPGFPVAVALADPILRFGLRKSDFLALIEGMETDAADRLVIPSMDQLLVYCDRVACAVGRLSNRVFGVDEEKGDLVAKALGQALQLTNILSDLSEDAMRGRLYLPLDLLAAHGVCGGGCIPDPKAVLAHPAASAVCDELAELAARRFAEASEVLSRCDRRQMRPALMMMHVYRRILDRLKSRGWLRIDERVRLSKAEKLWLAVRHGLF